MKPLNKEEFERYKSELLKSIDGSDERGTFVMHVPKIRKNKEVNHGNDN